MASQLNTVVRYTIVKIINNTDNSISLGHLDSDIIDWSGNGERPQLVEAQSDDKFKHELGIHERGPGSVGGNAYIYNDKVKWIFAWSSTHDGKNKVYTDIQKANYIVSWDDIKNVLRSDKITNTTTIENDVYRLKSTVTVQNNNPPTITATLEEIH